MPITRHFYHIPPLRERFLGVRQGERIFFAQPDIIINYSNLL